MVETAGETGVPPMFLVQVTLQRALPARNVRSALRSAQSAHQIFDIFVNCPEIVNNSLYKSFSYVKLTLRKFTQY